MMLDDQLPTYTSEEQRDLERRVSVIYADFVDAGQVDENDEELVLNREAHVRYLHGGLGQLPSGASP